MHTFLCIYLAKHNFDDRYLLHAHDASAQELARIVFLPRAPNFVFLGYILMANGVYLPSIYIYVCICIFIYICVCCLLSFIKYNYSMFPPSPL